MKINNFGELRTTIRNGIDNYGSNFLLGFIDFDDNTYGEIKRRAKKIIDDYFRHEIITLQPYHKEVVSFSLVAYSIKERNLNNFWKGYSHSLATEINNISIFCQNCFRTFCLDNNLYFCKENDQNAFVTTIKTHSLVTEEKSYDLLLNLYKIYRYDLFESYQEENVDSLLKYIKMLFQGNLELEVQERKFLGHFNSFPKHFIRALNNSPILLGNILKRIFYNFDQYYYGENNFKFEGDRFDYYFKTYVINSSKNNNANHFTRRENKGEHIVRFKKVEFKLDNGKLFIFIPSQLTCEIGCEENLEYFDAKIIFYSNNEFLFEKKLDLIRGNIFYRTVEKEIRLDSFYPNLNYKIIFNENVVKEGRDFLCKNYLIFNENNKNINSQDIEPSAIRIVSDPNLKIEVDDCESDINEFNNYKITTLFLNKDSYFIIDDKILHPFDEILKNKISCNKYNNLYLDTSSGEKINIYKNVSNISLRLSDEINLDKLVLELNGFLKPVLDISTCKKRLITDETNDYFYTFYLNENSLEENKDYNIKIRERGSDRVIFKDNFIIIKEIEYKLDKNFYYNEKFAKLDWLKSSFKEINSLNLSINLEETKEFKINLKSGLSLVIDIPHLFWRLGKYNPFSKDKGSIFYSDIKDIPFESNITNDSTFIINSKEGELIESFKSLDLNLKERLDYYRNENNLDKIIVLLRKNNIIYPLFSLYYKVSIQNFESTYTLSSDNQTIKSIKISWSLIGKCELLIKLIDESDSKVLIETTVKEENSIEFETDGLKMGLYKIEIYKNERSFFGQEESELVFSKQLCLGDSFVLNSRIYGLRGTEFYSFNNDIKRVGDFSIRNLREVDSDSYIGEIYQKVNFQWVYYNRVNPVKMNFEKKISEKKVSFYVRDIDDNVITVRRNNKDYEINTMHFRVDRNEY